MSKRLADTLVLRRASIYANPESGFDTLPVVYGDLTHGDQGIVPCVCIQEWSGSTQIFLIADHAIDATAPTVWADNVLQSTGYTFSASTDVEGQGNVAILTFTVDMAGKKVSVKCKGKKNGASALIQNLAEIVADLLLNVHDLDPAEWDAAHYTQAYMDCARLGYVGGGVILEDGLPVNIADGIVQPMGGAFTNVAGELQLYVEALPTSPQMDEIFEESELDRITLERTVDAIINSVQLAYRFNWRKLRFASQQAQFDAQLTDDDEQSQADFKLRARRAEARWLRSDAAAAAAAATILALSHRPRWTFTAELKGFRALLQQPADLVALSSRVIPGGSGRGMPGDRRVMRVRSVTVDQDSNGITLVGLDLENNYWTDAYKYDGTRLYDGSFLFGRNP